MTRLGGPAVSAAAFALTAGLACDAGGFNRLSWDRALVVIAAVSLLAVILGTASCSRDAAVVVGAFALVAAWTASSWFWSESPPRALEEAQRVALYAAVAAAVVVLRARLTDVALGVAGAAAFVAIWNLVTRIHGVANPHDTGAGSAPVGYANSLGLLCVVGLLLLPALPRIALMLAPPLAADLVLQSSSGALAALAAGGLTWAFVALPRVRAGVVVLAVAALLAAPFAARGHARTQYWHVALREARAHPVLGSGAGTFANWWLRERPVPFSSQEAHSLYVETLAELGPLGLAFVLAAFAAPAAVAWRRRQPVAAGVVAAYAVGAAFDFHWELAGVTVPAVLVAASAAVGGGGRLLPRTATVPAFVALTAAAVLAYGGTSRLVAAQAALRVGDERRAVAAAHSALRLAPFDAAPWAVIGDATGDPAAYRRALALDANDWSLWARLARVSKGAPRRLAEREAARLNPLGASGP